MFKRIMLAVALVASALIGATAITAAVPEVAGATCSQPSSIDFGWHDGRYQVFHIVADFYVDQSNCRYVTHYNTDCYLRAGGTVLNCAEGWTDQWNVITHIGDSVYTPSGWTIGTVTFGPPVSSWAGVQLAAPNSNAAWCELTWYNGLAICAQSYSGTEHHASSIGYTQWAANWGTSTGARVDINF